MIRSYATQQSIDCRYDEVALRSTIQHDIPQPFAWHGGHEGREQIKVFALNWKHGCDVAQGFEGHGVAGIQRNHHAGRQFVQQRALNIQHVGRLFAAWAQIVMNLVLHHRALPAHKA